MMGKFLIPRIKILTIKGIMPLHSSVLRKNILLATNMQNINPRWSWSRIKFEMFDLDFG